MGGLAVENFRLLRVDGLGYLEADGALPEHGVANLRVRAFGIELGELRRLSPAFPAISGRLAAEAAILGPVSAPQMRLSMRVDSLAAGGVTSDRLMLSGRYDNQRMDVTGDLTFADNEVIFSRAEQGEASAIIVGGPFQSSRKLLIRVANARVAFARALELFFPEPTLPPGVHPSAVIAPTAQINPAAQTLVNLARINQRRGDVAWRVPNE